jgi:hypothetical protein
MSKKQEQFPDIVETDFFIAWDDPDTETVSVGFLDRNLVMDFDYGEFLDFAEVVDAVRDYINRTRSARPAGPNGVPPLEH